MNYEVQVVDDGDLPEGHDLVIVERGPDQPHVMLLCGRLAQAFLAVRQLEDLYETPCVPTELYVPPRLYAAS
ncbi:MAG: hypothetical protein ABWX71_04775 [Aeromicrobium sp.]